MGRNPTKQFSFDQHSLLGVAIGRLSIRRPALCPINALERRLWASEARLDAGGCRPTPFKRGPDPLRTGPAAVKRR